MNYLNEVSQYETSGFEGGNDYVAGSGRLTLIFQQSRDGWYFSVLECHSTRSKCFSSVNSVTMQQHYGNYTVNINKLVTIHFALLFRKSGFDHLRRDLTANNLTTGWALVSAVISPFIQVPGQMLLWWPNSHFSPLIITFSCAPLFSIIF